MFLFAFLSRSSFWGDLQCGMCTTGIDSSRKYIVDSLKNYNYKKECTKLMPKNAKMCEDVAPELFITFFDMAPSNSICRIVEMCDRIPIKNNKKAQSRITKEKLMNTKYNNKCTLLTHLADYFLGKGLREFTIPYITTTLKKQVSQTEAFKPYLDKINYGSIKRFVNEFNANYTSKDIAKRSHYCREL